MGDCSNIDLHGKPLQRLMHSNLGINFCQTNQISKVAYVPLDKCQHLQSITFLILFSSYVGKLWSNSYQAKHHDSLNNCIFSYNLHFWVHRHCTARIRCDKCASRWSCAWKGWKCFKNVCTNRRKTPFLRVPEWFASNISLLVWNPFWFAGIRLKNIILATIEIQGITVQSGSWIATATGWLKQRCFDIFPYNWVWVVHWYIKCIGNSA